MKQQKRYLLTAESQPTVDASVTFYFGQELKTV